MSEAQGQSPEKKASPRHRNELRKVRKAAGVSSAELASVLGVRQKTIQGWESGRNSLRGDTILAICEYLGCTPNDILGYDEKGPLTGTLRAMTEDLDEVCDLYLDNDFAMQSTVKQILHANARHPEKHTKHAS